MTTPRVDLVDTVIARDVFCLYPLPRGTVAALRGLTLRVGRGERLVVHGPNGSGKTTLLRVLLGEQPVSAGSVIVDGIELAGARAGRARACCDETGSDSSTSTAAGCCAPS